LRKIIETELIGKIIMDTRGGFGVVIPRSGDEPILASGMLQT